MASILIEKKLLFTIVLVLGIWVSQSWSRSLYEATMLEKHEMWMSRHGRAYKDSAEKEKRFKIFKDNMEYIESVNKAGNQPFKLGPNAFLDQTNEEFQASHNGYKRLSYPSSSQTATLKYENVTPATDIDWRQKGAVTPIKDQGQCGSCWAFSAVATMEGINQIKKGKLISLSEQELIDCDTSGENQGCSGGLMDNAFKFIIKNKGLANDSIYPYQQEEGSCNKEKTASHAAEISDYKDVPVNDEAALLKAVSQQPVSVAIDAGGRAFQFYSGGVFTGKCGTNLDHGVTAVGYGTADDGTKYWLVKNSWGKSWGDNGYIMMERDVDDKEGLCGIAMQASFPTLD